MLVVAALAAAGVSYEVVQPVKPGSPLVRYAPCVQKVLGPTPLYWCANGRAYVLQNGAWVDVGPLSSGPPQVPRS